MQGLRGNSMLLSHIFFDILWDYSEPQFHHLGNGRDRLKAVCIRRVPRFCASFGYQPRTVSSSPSFILIFFLPLEVKFT